MHTSSNRALRFSIPFSCFLLLALPSARLQAQAAKAAEPAKAARRPAPSSAGYHKGFFIRSADQDFELKVKGRVQVRVMSEVVEGADPEAAFSIPRARLKLEGKLWSGLVKTKLQLDFGKGFASLKDAVIAWKAGDGFTLSAGQFKKPFSRQELSSSGKQAFVDRAITAKGFGAGRDIGVMAHNNFSHSPRVEWAVGVFNGSGDKSHFKGSAVVDRATGVGPVQGGKFSNVPALFGPSLVLRVGYNHGKLKGYSEADLEGGAPRFGVGFSLSSDLGSPDGSFGHRQELDAILKVQGLSLSAALLNTLSASGSAFSNLSEGTLGARVQAGYVFSEHYQAALRWALVDPPAVDDSLQELTLGLSDYVHGHHLKLQLDGGARLHGDGTTDLIVRLQTQLAF